MTEWSTFVRVHFILTFVVDILLLSPYTKQKEKNLHDAGQKFILTQTERA